ncbi:unnamed protein product [Eruca vesicaria subsp. sativa]|uniref:Uncharacterized protein n=1 Tax=Eruca vesicaria subsp. sativa TaxID=29727 RepID=A0ABC8KJG5_ERUVS|nr:unnamed protein product [Eruca vesicaria subsp. sativa]
MVFPGEEEEEDYTTTTGHDNRPKKKKQTLHNFSFTDLKWGVQRNLRCTKIESNGGSVVAVDQRLRRRSSPPNRSRGLETENDGGEEGIEEEKRSKKEEREVSPPWNLRKRRAACKAPVTDCGGNQKKEGGLRIGEGENGVRRDKFVSTLLTKEVEDDYVMMVGHRPPRRPKKRHRNVQRQINSLYPAFYFGEVTEDIYDVPDAADNGKK